MRPACRNLSGLWQPASSGLALRYHATALREGTVYDSRLHEFAPLARKSKPWKWQRNTSRPELLVFRELQHTEASRTLPLADEIDWLASLRGRCVIFIGDSLGEHQATNLLLLASDESTTSIESVRRPFSSKSGENMQQTSWCRAVCAKVHGIWSASNRCQRVHTIVCWLSAAKSEAPSVLQRTLGNVAAWALASVGATLTQRDIVVGNAGHHFHPWDSRWHVHQLASFVNVCRWHKSTRGRWRQTPRSSGQTSAASSARPPAGHAAATTPMATPHIFLREAGPQIWARGVFPGAAADARPSRTREQASHRTGRIGTSSPLHDCLPPWPYEPVQQVHMQRSDAASRANSSLDVLLGPRAFHAYNGGLCEAVAGSPVDLLRVWLPTALLGARESAHVGDCTHAMHDGSTYAFWNQLLLHAVWRRGERLGVGLAPHARPHDPARRQSRMLRHQGREGAPDDPNAEGRFVTWERLREMLISSPARASHWELRKVAAPSAHRVPDSHAHDSP